MTILDFLRLITSHHQKKLIFHDEKSYSLIIKD